MIFTKDYGTLTRKSLDYLVSKTNITNQTAGGIGGFDWCERWQLFYAASAGSRICVCEYRRKHTCAQYKHQTD